MTDFEIKETVPLTGEGVKGDGLPHWYVVHTYSGHEKKVKVNIEKMVENRNMQNQILEVVVPTEDVVEIKDGRRKVKNKKMFPGYVLIKMVDTNESWFLVRNTQGVTGFVGHGTELIPLTDEEIARMGIEKVRIEFNMEVGDTVRILEGRPFDSSTGIIESINEEKQTLVVRISIMGRDTPLDYSFYDVERVY